MKTKLVNRYYCDFCKKANCSAPSMTKHERRCTANPNRVCGVCEVTGHEQVPLTEIAAALQLDIESTPPSETLANGEGVYWEVDPARAFTAADSLVENETGEVVG